MAKFLIAEQESFGKIHFRVMREDGDRRVGGYHSLDMESLDDAQLIVNREIDRNKLGPSTIMVRRLNSQACEVACV